LIQRTELRGSPPVFVDTEHSRNIQGTFNRHLINIYGTSLSATLPQIDLRQINFKLKSLTHPLDLATAIIDLVGTSEWRCSGEAVGHSREGAAAHDQRAHQ
jgi:hypothetical protein